MATYANNNSEQVRFSMSGRVLLSAWLRFLDKGGHVCTTLSAPAISKDHHTLSCGLEDRIRTISTPAPHRPLQLNLCCSRPHTLDDTNDILEKINYLPAGIEPQFFPPNSDSCTIEPPVLDGDVLVLHRLIVHLAITCCNSPAAHQGRAEPREASATAASNLTP